MRLESASAQRNEAPILGVLQRIFATGADDILEIASGSGQHAAAFSRTLPVKRWWTTDVDPAKLESIEIWRAESTQQSFQPPQQLDVTSANWTNGGPIENLPGALDGIVCVNMIHISPWQAAEGLFAGAAHRLKPGGVLYIYGPFARDGAHTSEGNLRFDASLRGQDPSWGIRALEEGEARGSRNDLTVEESFDWPANTLPLIFRQ